VAAPLQKNKEPAYSHPTVDKIEKLVRQRFLRKIFINNLFYYSNKTVAYKSEFQSFQIYFSWLTIFAFYIFADCHDWNDCY